MTSSSSESHGWSCVLCVQSLYRPLLSPWAVLYHGPHVHRRRRRGRHVHRRDRRRRSDDASSSPRCHPSRATRRRRSGRVEGPWDELKCGARARTVGTNAVLERRGARVAVLTRRFRDLIEIRASATSPHPCRPSSAPSPSSSASTASKSRRNADGSVLVPSTRCRSSERWTARSAAPRPSRCACSRLSQSRHERLIADIVKSRAPGCPCRARPTWLESASSSVSPRRC